MNDVRTETIWHHQTTELPPVVDHPHRRRILASFYAGCGVLGLVSGVAIAELAAAPPLIPPAAVASHGTSSLTKPAVKAKPRPATSTTAPAVAKTKTLKVASVPSAPRSARAVADEDPTPTPTGPPFEVADPTPSTPPYDGPTATKSGPQGFPTASTPPPSDSPRPPA